VTSESVLERKMKPKRLQRKKETKRACLLKQEKKGRIVMCTLLKEHNNNKSLMFNQQFHRDAALMREKQQKAQGKDGSE
jgi:hypothetical protein